MTNESPFSWAEWPNLWHSEKKKQGKRGRVFVVQILVISTGFLAQQIVCKAVKRGIQTDPGQDVNTKHISFLFALASGSVYAALHWWVFTSKPICAVGKEISTERTANAEHGETL